MRTALAVVLLIVAGCIGGGSGDDSCTEIADCPDGEICVGGSCTALCNSDSQCGEGRYCDNGACAVSVCGDGVQQGSEECDAGAANADGGGCTASCAAARCGDDLLYGGVEACDNGLANSDAVADACRTDCTPPRCGDGVPDTGEQCDDGNTIVDACTYGLTSCVVCAADCTDTAGVVRRCGDNVTDAADGEDCDGSAPLSATCVSLSLPNGIISCDGDCQFDTTGCTGTGPICGDGVKNGTDECDDTDFGIDSCISLGFIGGSLDCSGTCTRDTAGCVVGTGAAFEPCPGGASCLAGLDCTAIPALGGDVCVQDCSTAPPCVSTEVCEPTAPTVVSCMPRSDVGQPCLTDLACNDGAPVCMPVGDASGECRQLCDGARLGDSAGCTSPAGSRCLGAPFLEFQGGTGSPVPCAGLAPPNTCDAGNNYRCMHASGDFYCVRPLGVCGIEAEVQTDLSLSGVADAVTRGGEGEPTLCQFPGLGVLCPEEVMPGVDAPIECAMTSFVFPSVAETGAQIPCDDDGDCFFYDGVCSDPLGTGNICVRPAGICVAFCETQDGSYQYQCLGTQWCGAPEANISGYVPEYDSGSGAIIDCSTAGSSVCSTGSGFFCQSFTNGSFCGRPRRVCQL